MPRWKSSAVLSYPIAEMMNTRAATNGAVMTPIALRPGVFRSSEDFHITGRVGVRWRCSDEPTHSRKTKREDHYGHSERPQVSHFETRTHLMLRRSPSARGGVIGRRSQCIDGRRGEPMTAILLLTTTAVLAMAWLAMALDAITH
jgi:hypothetical protein